MLHIHLVNCMYRAQPFHSIKLMLVGEANKGKTSLLLSLAKRGKMTHYSKVGIGKNSKPLSTVGVDLGEYKYSPHASRPIVTFMTWDFGGQVNSYTLAVTLFNGIRRITCLAFLSWYLCIP